LQLLGDTAATAYDVELAHRVRDLLLDEPGITEKKTFGGLAFLINGRLAVSSSGQGGLLVRVDPTRTDSLIRPPHIDRFEMRGQKMSGWLRVELEVVAADEDLRRWVALGTSYASSLPPAK